eukprot:UN21672
MEIFRRRMGKNPNRFRNPLYDRTYVDRILRPSANLKDMKLWTNYYMRYTSEDVCLHKKLRSHYARIRRVQSNTRPHLPSELQMIGRSFDSDIAGPFLINKNDSENGDNSDDLEEFHR